MPFDLRDFPGASASDRAISRKSRRLVALWLFAVAAMILVMIGLGGATRLTGSGLSIMEWAPLMGALPPMSDAEWQRLFALYQQIPQYSLVNHGFGIEGFRHIFWLEWTHRLWGRLIGLVFLGPLVWFVITRRIERRMIGPLGVLFVLGGLQGAVGWFMVASGFEPDSTAVSPYRLTVHLALALLLYGATIWFGLSVLNRPRLTLPRLRALSWISLGSLAMTILAGGFVAGLHAGLDYNTFPLMAGRLVPAGYAELHPFVRNLTENIAAVQFDHRVLATLTLVIVTVTAITGLVSASRHVLGGRLLMLAGAVAVQYCLGVTTLLWVVPVELATAHQIGAVLLLTALLIVVHAVTARRPTSGGGG
jgi:heme a synthase